MKKGAVKFSGVLTLFMGIFLLFCSVLTLGNAFNIEFIKSFTSSGILNTMYLIADGLFIAPIRILLSGAGLAADLINKILVGVLIAFSLFLLFWGIKELTLPKKPDDKYAHCKKTCMFPLLLKLFVFIYSIVFVVLSFVMEDFISLFADLGATIGFDLAPQIILGVFGIFMLLGFILPLSNFSKAAKMLQEGNYNQEEQYGEEGYQDQYYNYTQTDPLDPNTLIQGENVEEGGVFSIVPGKDGVPANITQKGLEDLARLERLKASGAIDEQNYIVMKEKVCATNVE